MPKPPGDQQSSWPQDADHAFVASFLRILRDARLEQGLSIREVAKKADIDHGIIARGENMERIPNLITMRRWVRGLDLDWQVVYSDAENAGL